MRVAEDPPAKPTVGDRGARRLRVLASCQISPVAGGIGLAWAISARPFTNSCVQANSASAARVVGLLAGPVDRLANPVRQRVEIRRPPLPPVQIHLVVIAEDENAAMSRQGFVRQLDHLRGSTP